MSFGSLALRFHQKYKHGLVTAHYRDTVRNRILNSLPIFNTIDSSVCEVHVLTSAADYLNLIWALKSFYHYSRRSYALCIHDDGSLTSEQCSILKHHFPNARLIYRFLADETVLPRLTDYPRCLEFRKTNQLSPKIFDFAAYLKSDRMLLLDSDILFFAEPTELLKRVEDPQYCLNSVNQDVATAYTVEPAVVKEKCGFELCPRFNSGLGLIHRASLNLDWLEEFLALPDIIGYFWRIEQTLLALCSSRYGVELLPDAYNVRREEGLNGSPCRHYVGRIRHLMYREGVRHLVKDKFLQKLNHPQS